MKYFFTLLILVSITQSLKAEENKVVQREPASVENIQEESAVKKREVERLRELNKVVKQILISNKI